MELQRLVRKRFIPIVAEIRACQMYEDRTRFEAIEQELLHNLDNNRRFLEYDLHATERWLWSSTPISN